jgi:hypothetical protein
MTPEPTTACPRRILTLADLEPLGVYRFPSPPSLQHTKNQFCLRRVGTELHAFAVGNSTDQYPVLEWIVPEAPPSFTMSEAPTLSLKRNWGCFYKDYLRASGSAKGLLGGLWWDDIGERLWWSYGSGYAPTSHHPTIGCTVLDDAAGTSQTYGPWKTEWHCQRTRGAWATIPAAFRPLVGGQRAAIMAPQSSGNVMSPFGASLASMALPDAPETEPPDYSAYTFTIGNRGILLYDNEHRQAKDPRFKLCGWNDPYDHTKGAWIRPPVATFGGDGKGIAESDTMNSVVTVETEDVWGLLYFGQLCTTPPDYTAPGDPDGFVHMWYGDPSHGGKYGDPTLNKHCCHRQDDPWWPSTGPGTHYRVAHSWTFAWEDLEASTLGTVPLSSVPARECWQWKQVIPQMRWRYRNSPFGGASFDPLTRRIYVYLRDMDYFTIKDRSRPVILVLGVRTEPGPVPDPPTTFEPDSDNAGADDLEGEETQ